jgi:hypothetical protein
MGRHSPRQSTPSKPLWNAPPLCECGRGPTELVEVQRSFFVSFGYTKDAEQECAASHKRTGRIIKLLTVQEILDEEHMQKM